MNKNTVNTRPEVPEAARLRPPTFIRCAIEKFGLPDAWREVTWEKKGFTPPDNFRWLEIRGAVYPHVKTSGKYKGEIDWKRPEDGTEMTVSLKPSEIEEWLARWEVETGLCRHCEGTGFAFAGWSRDNGSSYSPCDDCGQTGKSGGKT